MSKDLRYFLQRVREMGPDFYVEVKKPLKPKFEVCIIQEKLAREGRYPVIYCPNIEGSSLPLVTNLFGSYELLGFALDLDPKKVAKSEIIKEYRKREANPMKPQWISASQAPVKEVIFRGKEVDFGLLPVIHHQPLDSGKYLDIGFMICKDPDTGVPNCGVYRHEVKNKNEMSVEIAGPHHSAYIARRYAELGKPMEIVLPVGHHPATVIGSQALGSVDMNELEVIGGILNEPLRVTQGETVDLPVPADAEIAIEGVIDTRHMVTDGPFGEYTGYYGPVYPAYLIKVTAITMRKDAIYHDLDPAHREHNLATALGSESGTYDAIKKAVPTVQAVHCPPSGTCVYHIYVSIKKRLSGEGKLAALAALSGMPRCKLVVVVDEDIDVYNDQEVLWAIATRVRGDKDICIIPGVTSEHLDPCAYDETELERGYMASKVIIDATKPVERPFSTRITPLKEVWDSINLADYLK